ncbi:MAG: MFS transporter [Spirochaetes bacterium]|nr:MFS transporter [Spirochaetota bacterium]
MNKPSVKLPSILQRSLALVTVAGCLAMLYGAAVGSPMATDYFRKLGFTEVHFGILSGIPMIMVSFQFLGALWSNRLRSRRAVFMWLIISGRIMWLGVVLTPLIPGLAVSTRIALMLVMLALSNLLQNIGPPIWFSWMGDLIPRRIISRYWGGRVRWQQIVWLIAYIPLTVFGFKYASLGLTLPEAFTIVVICGVLAGVVDIILFLWIHEPEPAPVHVRPILETILEPMRQPQFRSYMIWNCAYAASAMIAAVFMLLYVLKVLGLPLWQVMIIWWTPGIGSALGAKPLGKLIDRYGSRPVLVLCTALKPLAPLIFFFITKETAFWGLSIFFIADNMLNVGQQLSTNGFMLRMAPRENRGMFAAAIASLPGLAGGLSAIVGGVLLQLWEGHDIGLFGHTWNNYQYLFLLSTVLRILCIPLALRIKEPESAHPRDVIAAIIEDWPSRMVALPALIFRRLNAPRHHEKKDD